ncbi:THUMP domain-containing protein 1 [Entomophthora muscae]|uniref:THUMP domain-containing protein 1 n=1 Tax=Entomophthora muscae TaxID=34485 RepID=A0ACC2S1D7_9FUNG|nr:THUMP domain-containing protein 1 [Entomophthora muscae]
MRVKETGVTGTRNLSDIELLATKLIDPVFCVKDPITNEIAPLKFAIAFNSRLCSQIKKEEVISRVASLVKEPHTVDLTKPDVTIVIEIFKNICGISLVRDFHELKKYNIQLVGQLGRDNLASKASQKDEAPIENA